MHFSTPAPKIKGILSILSKYHLYYLKFFGVFFFNLCNMSFLLSTNIFRIFVGVFLVQHSTTATTAPTRKDKTSYPCQLFWTKYAWNIYIYIYIYTFTTKTNYKVDEYRLKTLSPKIFSQMIRTKNMTLFTTTNSKLPTKLFPITLLPPLIFLIGQTSYIC